VNKTIAPEDIRNTVLETLIIISTESKEKIYAIKRKNLFRYQLVDDPNHSKKWT